MELLKREQKHHSLGNPFNIPPQKKTYPSRHFDSTRFWNLTTPKIHPVDNSADEVIFRNFHLMNFFNITTSLLSLIFCDRWEWVVMSLTGDSLMMETCPNQKFLTLDSPREEGEYNWSYLLICENQRLVRKVYGHINVIPFTSLSLSRAASLYCMLSFSQNRQLLAGSVFLSLPSLNPKGIDRYEKKHLKNTRCRLKQNWDLDSLVPGESSKHLVSLKKTCANSYTYLTL